MEKYMTISKSTALINMKIHQLAIDGVIHHKDISEELKKHYSNGFSADEVHFGKAFAKSCADQAFRLVEEGNTSITDAAFHLGRTTNALNNSEFAYGLMHFQEKLVNHFPEFTEDNKSVTLDVALQIQHGIERSEKKAPVLKLS